LGCEDVFGSWISSKLKYLAVIGYTSAIVNLIILYITFQVWRKISNGVERIMWHDRKIELGFFIATVLIVFIGGLVCGLGRPSSPKIFPYALEFPDDVVYTDINVNSNTISHELLETNQ
jgi:hypothetical protein